MQSSPSYCGGSFEFNKTWKIRINVFRNCVEKKNDNTLAQMSNIWRKDIALNFYNPENPYLLKARREITLVDIQIDAKNSYLFTYNTFIQILYKFRALHCSSSRGLRRNCIYAASGVVTFCRWLSCAPVTKQLEFFLNRCTRQSPAESDDTRGCTYTITMWNSWWWEGLVLETVEEFNKCIICE